MRLNFKKTKAPKQDDKAFDQSYTEQSRGQQMCACWSSSLSEQLAPFQCSYRYLLI